MRKAAGIILLILVVFGLVTMIIDVIDLGLGLPSPVTLLWPFVYHRIVLGGFFVAAGVLCLKRKYWGLCLAPALFGFLTSIPVILDPVLRGGNLSISATWETWILIIGALISTIFICLRKSEWSESQP